MPFTRRNELPIFFRLNPILRGVITRVSVGIVRRRVLAVEEPSFLLRAAMWHFGSGDAFFVGWGLFLLASGLSFRGAKASRTVPMGLLSLVWLALANGATQSVQHFWSAYMVWVAGIVLVCVLVRYWSTPHKTLQPRESFTGVAACAAVVCGAELWSELPIGPVAPQAASVAIIGDSVTAGLNAGDHTWPRQLAAATGRTVYDASQQGATVKSALEQLETLDGRGEVLWIEIGGNDILENLPSDVYGERLETLLLAATKLYPKIVLMEIPAPPGGDRYGLHQRQLAAKYHIVLVPKRQFLAVLTSSGATQDGVHLANAGHQRMANVVQRTLGWISSTVSEDDGLYIRCE